MMIPKDNNKESQIKRKKKDMRQTQTPGIGKQPYMQGKRGDRPSFGDELPTLEDQHDK